MTRERLDGELVKILQRQQESGLNALRDQAQELDAEAEFAELDRLVAALLTTGDDVTRTPAGRAFARAEAFDPDRNLLFDAVLAAAIRIALLRGEHARRPGSLGPSSLCSSSVTYTRSRTETDRPSSNERRVDRGRPAANHRPDRLSAGLSRRVATSLTEREPETLVRALDRAHEFSVEVPFPSARRATEAVLEATHAFDPERVLRLPHEIRTERIPAANLSSAARLAQAALRINPEHGRWRLTTA